MLIFTALNLKKLTNRSWDSPRNSCLQNVLIGSTYYKPSFRLRNEGLSTIWIKLKFNNQTVFLFICKATICIQRMIIFLQHISSLLIIILIVYKFIFYHYKNSYAFRHRNVYILSFNYLFISNACHL